MVMHTVTRGVTSVAKTLLKRTIYRPGTIARVLRGPLRGSRFMLRETPNWSSIVGRWEPGAARIYALLVQPGDVVYDCGANVGMHALLFSKLVGSGGRVLAVEPLPAAARDVLLNCALNAAGNVEVLECALGDRGGFASFEATDLTTHGSLSDVSLQRAARQITVRVSTLDEIVEERGAEPDFIKMDIEGGEGRALAAFHKVARSYPTLAIDLHSPEQDLEVGAFLARHDYAVYRLGDGVARREGQRSALQRVTKLDRGWPNKDGIWGTVVAVHPTRAADLLPPATMQTLAPDALGARS